MYQKNGFEDESIGMVFNDKEDIDIMNQLEENVDFYQIIRDETKITIKIATFMNKK